MIPPRSPVRPARRRFRSGRSGLPTPMPSMVRGRVTRLLIALLVLLLIGWGLGALCRSLLTTIDLRAVRDIASERTAAQTTVAHVLSWIGSGYVVFPLTLVCCAILYLGGRRWRSLAVGLSTLGAVVIADLDKLLVGRPRPPVHHLEKVMSGSFPSGHSAHSAAFVTALLLALFAACRPAWLKIAAATAGSLLVLGIAASRVYLGVHYPSDVVFGVLLGTGCALFASHDVIRVRPSVRDGEVPDDRALG
jgi:membrane-associated phospholipid phosphatase